MFFEFPEKNVKKNLTEKKIDVFFLNKKFGLFHLILPIIFININPKKKLKLKQGFRY